MRPGEKDWKSWVEAPIVVADADAEEWDRTADVVVVGFGGAGVCSAIEAAERGAEVLVVERFAPGGATRLSGGVYYGGGTRWQKEAGVEDDAENMYAYLKVQIRGAVEDDTLRRFCEESNSSLEWLASHGVAYSGKAFHGKASYPPKGHYLYYSGNERLKPYRDIARPAPRGHRAFHSSHPPGMTGFAYFDPLQASAEKLGVEVLSHAPVARLILDRTGAVVGVESLVMEGDARAEHEKLRNRWIPLNPLESGRRRRIQKALEALERKRGTRRRFRARHGVILSTGGFIHNWAMVKDNAHVNHVNTVRLGSPGCDGAGIRLGQSVGGLADSMDHFDNSRTLRPDLFTRGMLLNARGERFVNEEAYSGTIGEVVVENRYDRIWLIVDRDLRSQAIKFCTNPNQPGGFFFFGLPTLLNLAFTTRKASTIEGLARKLGMDPVKAREALNAYNSAAAGRAPDPMGKDPPAMQAMTEGPYYAVDQSPGCRYTPLLAFTTGGLKVDETTGAVRREDGSAIPGLYAAGRTAIGVCSNSYVSGMSIADCVFSGRRAARSCAAKISGRGAAA